MRDVEFDIDKKRANEGDIVFIAKNEEYGTLGWTNRVKYRFENGLLLIRTSYVDADVIIRLIQSLCQSESGELYYACWSECNELGYTNDKEGKYFVTKMISDEYTYELTGNRDPIETVSAKEGLFGWVVAIGVFEGLLK